MKNILKYVVLFCFFGISYAQVGIGTTTPDGSSILDISATDKGVLVPRMTQSQRDLIGSPVNGLLIYQTDSSPGFYYYDGSAWVNISANTDAWSKTGNTGTNPSTNFIGTSDAQDLTFRTSNLEKMRLTEKGQLEFSNASNSIYIGEEAGENDNQTNNTNIGIGHQALFRSTNGYDNIAIGRAALTNNTIGRDNTAIGEEALMNNLTGIDNIAIGDKLLVSLTTGSNNIAMGDRTLELNNGSSNIAIGSSAGLLNLGSSNMLLGHSAGSTETGSNKLYIENSSANADNALIYGEFDNDILRTNGELQIGNPAGTGYAFPTIDGSLNQVLTSDGNGQLSFLTPASGGSDADWFQEGTTTAPMAITDDIYTQGNVAIGKNTADSPLDIEVTGAPANLIALKIVDNSTGTGDHIGIQQALGGTHNESIKGLETYVNNTGTGLHTGISTSVANGTGNQTGNRTTVNGATGTNTAFSGTIFNSGAGSSTIQTGLSLSVQQPTSQISYGLFNSLNASGADASGTKYGIYNLLDAGLGNHYGVYNDVRGLGANTKYGTYNLFGIGTTDTGGELYGNYNSFGASITSTLDKYGNYTLIPATLAGTHYGTYADVQSASGYAAYFVGRTSLGNTTANRYTMPAADGAAGEVLTTAGDGTTSWAAAGAGTPSIINVNTSSAFSIPGTNVWVLIPFNSENLDTNSEFNSTTSQFTATNGGYYRIHARTTIVEDNSTQLGIFVNGSLLATNVQTSTNGSEVKTIQIDEILSLNATDTVEIRGFGSSGGTFVYSGTTASLPRLTSLQIHRLN